MYQKYIKRILDILMSLILLPIMLIIFIPVAILIKMEDKGSVFFNGSRLGQQFREFKMLKFRTMKENAPDIRNSDGSTFNSDNDPRVTNVGRILRKTSLDEVPQVMNVLKGDMSFVGPRPSPLGNTDKYPEFYKQKFNVKPGITGYNQAILRNSATMEERMKNDYFYANNVSFTLDAYIIVKTIVSVLQQKNINK
ncbi:sugar transferase [Macrococcus sp. S115]|uniref:sugar transferase n=1 Tax=Macrococcus sp. S115 TaxID=3047480 RepID=UPI0024BD0946|nr:sugar transferase [Macrococcus sp. S115]MDJ1110925.1 sugar transferase [Macrococcus sp. S115]